VAAAVAAARLGTEVLRVERYGLLGGAATNSGVNCFAGFYTSGDDPRPVVAGVGGEMVERLRAAEGCLPPFRAAGSRNTVVPFLPEVAKCVLDEMLADAGVRLRLHTWVTGAEVAGRTVRAAALWSKGGPERACAQVFVDCTGDADLVAFAGGAFAFGNEDGTLQAASMYFTVTGVDRERLARLTRPEIADLVGRAHAEGWPMIAPQPGLFVPLPHTGEVLCAFHRDLGVNGLDAESLTRGEVHARRAAASYLRLFRERFPGFEGARLCRTGPQLGIRETRRVMGRYVLHGRECMEGARFADAVARGGWPIEIHDRDEGRAYARYGYIRGDGYYDIPARALIARDLDNVLTAGRCLSASHGAQASARVMGTAWATGHAAGALAAVQSRGARDPLPNPAGRARPDDEAWYGAAQEALRSQGALI
jgi:hypothetical protein